MIKIFRNHITVFGFTVNWNRSKCENDKTIHDKYFIPFTKSSYTMRLKSTLLSVIRQFRLFLAGSRPTCVHG